MPPLSGRRQRGRYSCLPSGEYDAEIISATKAISKAGNPMCVLDFGIEYNGRRFRVKDWIVQGRGNCKVEPLAIATGNQLKHKANLFRLTELAGACLRIKIKLEKDTAWGFNNRVEQYLPAGLGDPPLIPFPHPEQPKPAETNGEYPF